MAMKDVHLYLEEFGRGNDILEMGESTATVQLAADALGVIPARIAKTIALKSKEGGAVLVVAAGDAKMDNKKFKEAFGLKPKMLSPEETLETTGHAVGGVCPFALPKSEHLLLALDESLKRFQTVFPACGSSNSAVEVTIPQLEEYTGTPIWVDVCKEWDPLLG